MAPGKAMEMDPCRGRPLRIGGRVFQALLGLGWLATRLCTRSARTPERRSPTRFLFQQGGHPP